MTMDEAIAVATRGDDKYQRWPLATMLEAADEIERLREALQEVVDHCRNTGHGSPLVDERIVERCEETAVLALKR